MKNILRVLIFLAYLIVKMVSVSSAETWNTIIEKVGVYGIVADSHGTVWMVNGGVFSYTDGILTLYPLDTLPYDTGYESITIDKYGNLWIGGEGGLTVYDGVEWRGIYKNASYDEAITTIVIGNNDDIWIGTENAGAAKYDGESWTRYTVEDGLADKYVSAIAVEPSGVVWIGTLGDGLSRFDGVSWTTFTTDNGLESNDVTALYVDSKNTLWCATECILYRHEDGQWLVQETGLETIDRRIKIKSIVEDGDSVIWVAGDWWFGFHNVGPCDYYTSGGIARYDGETWTLFTKKGGMPNDAIECMAVGKDGSILIGTICGSYMMSTSDQAVAKENDTCPCRVKIKGNYPNPFNPETTIEFLVNERSTVTISVINAAGQKVRTLLSSDMPAGRYQVTWDGTDDEGEQVSSGMYFSILETPQKKSVGRMLLMR